MNPLSQNVNLSYFDQARFNFQSEPFETPRAKATFKIPIETWGVHCTHRKDVRRYSYRVNSYIPLESLSEKALFSFKITSQITGKTIQVHLFKDPVNRFEVDGVINAANETLLGGGGVDQEIHDGAGPNLVKECAFLDGCAVGEAVITKGYDLPGKYVLHTVGPLLKETGAGDTEALESCYNSCLDLCDKYRLRSVVAPCVACGFYAFPLAESAKVVRKVLQDYVDSGRSVLKTVVLSVPRNIESQTYLNEFSQGNHDSPSF